MALLKQEEGVLRSLGLSRLSLFGSTARGNASAQSDIDVAVQLDPGSRVDLFSYAAIADRLRTILGRPVDVVTEPNRSRRVQAMIDRDRVHVF